MTDEQINEAERIADQFPDGLVASLVGAVKRLGWEVRDREAELKRYAATDIRAAAETKRLQAQVVVLREEIQQAGRVMLAVTDAWGHSWDCSADPGHSKMALPITGLLGKQADIRVLLAETEVGLPLERSSGEPLPRFKNAAYAFAGGYEGPSSGTWQIEEPSERSSEGIGNRVEGDSPKSLDELKLPTREQVEAAVLAAKLRLAKGVERFAREKSTGIRNPFGNRVAPVDLSREHNARIRAEALEEAAQIADVWTRPLNILATDQVASHIAACIREAIGT